MTSPTKCVNSQSQTCIFYLTLVQYISDCTCCNSVHYANSAVHCTVQYSSDCTCCIAVQLCKLYMLYCTLWKLNSTLYSAVQHRHAVGAIPCVNCTVHYAVQTAPTVHAVVQYTIQCITSLTVHAVVPYTNKNIVLPSG